MYKICIGDKLKEWNKDLKPLYSDIENKRFKTEKQAEKYITETVGSTFIYFNGKGDFKMWIEKCIYPFCNICGKEIKEFKLILLDEQIKIKDSVRTTNINITCEDCLI